MMLKGCFVCLLSEFGNKEVGSAHSATLNHTVCSLVTLNDFSSMEDRCFNWLKCTMTDYSRKFGRLPLNDYWSNFHHKEFNYHLKKRSARLILEPAGRESRVWYSFGNALAELCSHWSDLCKQHANCCNEVTSLCYRNNKSLKEDPISLSQGMLCIHDLFGNKGEIANLCPKAAWISKLSTDI